MLSRFSGIDILINNAAFQDFKPIANVTEESLKAHFEVNVFAPLDLSRRCLPGMRAKDWGRIINISSSIARLPIGPPFRANDRFNGPLVYGMTKAALNRFTAGLAAEVEGTGIAVNGVEPALAVRTESVAAMLRANPSIQESPFWKEEPVEVMAEAVLALCLVGPKEIAGETDCGSDYLKKIGRSVKTLDGHSDLEI